MKWQTSWFKRTARSEIETESQTHASARSECLYLKASPEPQSLIRDKNGVHITKSQLLKIVLPSHLSSLWRFPSLSPKASPASAWPNTLVISCDNDCRTHMCCSAQHDQFLFPSRPKLSLWRDESWLVWAGSLWSIYNCHIKLGDYPVTGAEHLDNLTCQAAAHPDCKVSFPPFIHVASSCS